MLGGGDTVVAKTDSAPPSMWGSESSGKGEQLARHLEDGVSRALTGDAQAGRRLEEVNRADLGSLPGGGVKVMNLFIRLLGAGGRCSRQREQHMQMPRGGEVDTKMYRLYCVSSRRLQPMGRQVHTQLIDTPPGGEEATCHNEP